MDHRAGLRIAIVEGQMQPDFAGGRLVAHNLVALRIHHAEVRRLHVTLGNHGRCTQHSVVSQPSGNVPFRGGDQPLFIQTPPGLADLLGQILVMVHGLSVLCQIGVLGKCGWGG